MRRVFLLSLALIVSSAWPAAAQTGMVTGTVTRSADATPVAFSSMYLCSAPFVCQFTSTDAAGNYVFTVAPNTYYLMTSFDGLINEIYNNIQCPGYCDSRTAVQTGTPLVVTSGGVLAGINIALDSGGTISGTVTNSATSTGVSGVHVNIYVMVGASIVQAGFGSTNGSGAYSISGLPTGTYFASTSNTGTLIPELYDNIQCFSFCSSPERGTPIPVTVGATTSGRHFALDPGATISGTVRRSDTMAPLTGIRIGTGVRGAGSTFIQTTLYVSTNASGAFSITGLPTGTYYLATQNTDGFVNEFFDNVVCFYTCSDSAGATGVAVVAGSSYPNRDFALDRGGVVSGVVTNAATGAAINFAGVGLATRTASGVPVLAAVAFTDATGAYSISGIPPGTYYAYTNANGFIAEVFDNIVCFSSCSDGFAISVGAPIEISNANTVSGRNFALDEASRVTGTVLSNSSAPISGASVSVVAIAPDGSLFVRSATTNAAGEFTVTGLPAATYYAVATAAGFRGEFYEDVPCLSCFTSYAVTAGRAFAVAAASTTPGINFALDGGSSIAGVVTNQATGAPLPSVVMLAYRDVGDGYINLAGQTTSNSAGEYAIGGLPPGDYFVITRVNGFQNRIVGGVACPKFCSNEFVNDLGTTISVGPGATVSGRNVALTPMTGRIRGTVRDASTSAGVQSISVYVYARRGDSFTFVDSGFTNVAGGYEVAALAPGTYFAVTFSNGRYVDEMFDNLPCLVCSWGVGAVLTGTPITVGAGDTTVDFTLQPIPAGVPAPPFQAMPRIANFAVTFQWSVGVIGVTGYVLEVGLAPGTTLVSIPVLPGDTFGGSYRAAPVPPGRYFARVRARNAAGLSRPSNEVEFIVNADGSGAPDRPTSLLIFTDGPRVRATWAGSPLGGVTTDYVLEVGSATGLSNIAVVPVGSRSSFTYEGLPPPGAYFVRVRARNAASLSAPSNEVMLVIGNGPSPPQPPSTIEVAVDATRRVIVGWAPGRGTIAGYVLEVGSRPGQSDIAVIPLPPTVTTLPATGVPPGQYVFRVRAVNAMGMSISSYEMSFVMP